MPTLPLLSIIIPVYYNAQNLQPLYEDLCKTLTISKDFQYEILLIDDGSGDGSYAEMERLLQMDQHFRIFRLSRNFGSQAAILCGLSHARGDCAVIKAADLQEPTEMILDMFNSWQNGNNVVLAVRKGREDKKENALFSNMYYWLVRKFALPNMPQYGFDTFLLDRKMIDVLVNMKELNSSLTGQILWSGFQTDKVYYTRRTRTIGNSKWTLHKKLRLVSDTLFSFTSLPITIVSVIGGFSFVGSLIWAVAVLLSKMSGNIIVSGFTTLFIFQLFSFGVIMLTLGLLGGYLWRTFDASRKRPVYIIEDEKEKISEPNQ